MEPRQLAARCSRCYLAKNKARQLAISFKVCLKHFEITCTHISFCKSSINLATLLQQCELQTIFVRSTLLLSILCISLIILREVCHYPFYTNLFNAGQTKLHANILESFCLYSFYFSFREQIGYAKMFCNIFFRFREKLCHYISVQKPAQALTTN